MNDVARLIADVLKFGLGLTYMRRMLFTGWMSAIALKNSVCVAIIR